MLIVPHAHVNTSNYANPLLQANEKLSKLLIVSLSLYVYVDMINRGSSGSVKPLHTTQHHKYIYYSNIANKIRPKAEEILLRRFKPFFKVPKIQIYSYKFPVFVVRF